MIFLFPDVVLWIKGRKTYQSNFARVVFNLFIIIFVIVLYSRLYRPPDFLDFKQLQIQEKILVEGVEEDHYENFSYAFCV